jgi:hypothetical protein
MNPVDQEAARQRELEKQARANFIALKAQAHPDRPVVLHDEPAPPPPQPNAFASARRPAATPVPRANTAYQYQPVPRATPKSNVAWRPSFYYSPTPKPQASVGDTVYYWQVPSARQATSPRFQAAEARYARQLAKRPEDLTPEERMWAHEHF